MVASNPASGLTAVAFESRMAGETANLLHKYGFRCLSAPAMQEVPLEDHREVFAFAEHLFNRSDGGGGVDLMIYTTGVGTRMLVEILETRYERSEITEALSGITTLARGPKPLRELKKLGIPVDITIPEPNTWKEILDSLDEHAKTKDLSGKRVAIQEYGETNPQLNSGITGRGAELLAVPIYRWELPDDLAPLQEGIQAVIDGVPEIAVFTSKTQIRNALKAAGQIGKEASFREALNKLLVASVGPVCSRGLEAEGIEVDFIPSRPKLGVFIKELALSEELRSAAGSE